MSATGLERVFGEWTKVRLPNDPGIETVHVRVDPNGAYGSHWVLTDAQEQRLIDVLLADMAQRKR